MIKVGYTALLSIALLLQLISCNAIKNTLAAPRSPHEAYGNALTQAGLHQTALGQLWFMAASNSLREAINVKLPYKETGYFASDKPRAVSFRITLQRGQILKVSTTLNPAGNLKVFTELWQVDARATFKLLAAADTTSRQLMYEATASGFYIIRLQPELLKSTDYTVELISTPSLAFPVQQSGKPKIISTWGVGRDNGARKHEGIDIAAVFETPALAVSDGMVTSVSENKLGGKVIFMKPDNKLYTVYYAHLNKQLAVTGQRVNKGETIGLIGKTGNAQHTVPHLHFGIYTGNGAIDPQAFVDSSNSIPKNITASTSNINRWVRTAAVSKLISNAGNDSKTGNLPAGQTVFITSASTNLYKVTLPDKRTGFINSSSVTGQPLYKEKLKAAKKIFDQPVAGSAGRVLPAGTDISIVGVYNDFYLVQQEGLTGWINKQ